MGGIGGSERVGLRARDERDELGFCASNPYKSTGVNHPPITVFDVIRDIFLHSF